MPTPSENGLQALSSRRIEGTLSLFGFPDTDASVNVLPRSARWRGTRAAIFWGGALLFAPAFALVPPHVPWVVAILGIGGFLGSRKWRERYTVVGFRGECPKCGKPLSVRPGTPLKPIMSVGCEGCHHESRLEAIPPEAFPPTSGRSDR